MKTELHTSSFLLMCVLNSDKVYDWERSLCCEHEKLMDFTYLEFSAGVCTDWDKVYGWELALCCVHEIPVQHGL